jgi:hypothetical protein
MKPLYVAIALGLCLQTQAQIKYPQAKIEGHVLDESGEAITNTSIRGGFTVLKTTNPFDGQDDVGFVATTDSNGVFTVIGSTLGRCGFSVSKDGYYRGFAGADLDKHEGMAKWLPWPTVIKLKLRKIESPIAMYARQLWLKPLPALDAPVGYDLQIGDWVSPHGKGQVNDLLFTLHKKYQNRYDYEWDMKIQTPGDGNGLHPMSPADESRQSELRFPKTAPTNGYEISQLQFAQSAGAKAGVPKKFTTVTNSFFRIRTELDEQKQIKRAYYGKLIGPIIVDVHETKTAQLRFTYYLNPTSMDRNMEFDPKKNLFKDLQGMEKVSKP